jgi:hypothetical protein
MKRNNYLSNKTNPKLNFYSGAPINKGFYQRNLKQARKLYMDQYDRLKQDILKRRQDRELQELLSGYYKDYNKLAKKYPNLSKYEDYEKQNVPKKFDLNQFELKKKNINALFFKYDKLENEFDFELTDKLIDSMNDGNKMTYLNCFEIREDYKKRLSGKKTIEITDNKNNDTNNDNNNDNNNNNNNIIINNNPNPIYKNNSLISENKISLTIKSDKKIKENIVDVIQAEKKKENDEKIILTNTNYIPNQDLIKPGEFNKIEKEEEIDELTRYKNFLKKNKFPCFQNLLNPNNPTDYIPPTFIQDIQAEEKPLEKEEVKNNEEIEYNDFVDNFDNKRDENENILKISNNNNFISNQFPLIDNIIKEDIKGENSNSQNNIQLTEEKKDNNNNIDEEYEKENFDNILDNENNNEDKNNNLNGKDNNEINENKNENVVNEETNQNNNGDLKMLTDTIQDDKYPQFNSIISPYYKTNYLPPDIFIKPNEPQLDEPFENQNKYVESQMNVSELAKRTDTNDENKNTSNLPILKEKIINNENPVVENMINSNFSNNFKDDFNPRNDNKSENEEVNNNKIGEDNGGNIAVYNKFGVNMGNDFVPVENIIKGNQNIQNDNEENKKDDEKKEEEDEYNDFEVDN